MERLLYASFQDLSRLLRDNGEPFLASRQKWRNFFDHVLIVAVTGEEPHPADSGFIFMRMARQVLGIPEDRILHPPDALALLLRGDAQTVVFLDDFIGSGEQFITTWERLYSVSKFGSFSFAKLARITRHLSTFYCPLISTEYGMTRIQKKAPKVILNPAYILSARYSAISDDSLLWPDHLREQGRDFIRNASLRTGIQQWQGFHNLGLALAFEHSIPDASLPLFFWNENGWKPLIERK